MMVDSSKKPCDNPECGNLHTNARFCSRACASTGGGRPSFEPTDQQRRMVRAMVAYGVPLDDVTEVVEIDKKTLQKHFDREIKTAHHEANAKVAEALYKQAVEQGNTTAQIFWLKTKGGWKEAHKLEHTSPDGSMTPPSRIELVPGGQGDDGSD